MGVGVGAGLGLGVIPLGTIDGITDVSGVGDGVGEGEGVGAGLHSVPGRYSSFSELLELADAEGEAEADGDALALLAHGGPSISPSGRLKVSTLKCAWLRPLLMKSLRTELPTMVPKTPFMSWLPGPVCPTQAPITRFGEYAIIQASR